MFHSNQISVLVHLKCKQGNPVQSVSARFESSTRLSVLWPGVTRIFARVRIIETTNPDDMMAMLRDDIEGGHSVSDVENPEENQSRRPWSDDETSDADSADNTDNHSNATSAAIT